MSAQLLMAAFYVTVVTLSVSIAMVLWRLFRGPTLPDRVISVDMLGVLAVCFMSIYCLLPGVPVYLDAAVALALIAFLGTVAFARFIEEDARRTKEGS